MQQPGVPGLHSPDDIMKAAIAFHWGTDSYAKAATLAAMSEVQTRHVRRCGFGQNNSTLIVGKPFTHLGLDYAAEDDCPEDLTDPQIRRLVAGRYLV